MTLFRLVYCSIMHLGAFKKSQNHFYHKLCVWISNTNITCSNVKDKSKKYLKGPVISVITYITQCSQSNVKLDSLTN